ncbi:hsp70-Hsp90 organizing protein 3-like isoform X1, partial [Scomber scombrus]
DGAGEEDMDIQNGDAEPSDRRKDQDLSQAMLSGEEDGVDDEKKTRRRAERRRAKRKRQKERKKQEKEERMEDLSEQGEEVLGAVSESDSEEEMKVEEEWTAVRPKNKCSPESVPAFIATENKSNNQPAIRTTEEEPEWDVSSAFVANAASHIKVKGLKTRALQISRENKENEVRSSQVENNEEMTRRGESLAVQGIQLFQQGRYSQAVDVFTEAIYCDPKNHRFYGNRSSCYCQMEQYSSALSDAQKAIQLAPDWPMGYCYKASALMWLKRYMEVEKVMEEVLKLDQNCKEASNILSECRILQLMELGFEEEQSKLLLEKFTTVQAILTSPDAKALKQTPQQDQSGSCRSLWVGNITLEVSEKNLLDLFKMYGEIESIRVLHERFCAFINFKNANMAAKALDKLQGVELGGNRLVMRYPDRWIQRTTPLVQGPSAAGTQQSSAAAIGSRRRLPINGDECFYWRTTGCDYGDKCRFKHIPNQQGRDKKP